MNFLSHIYPQYKPLIVLGTAFFMDLILGDPVYKLHPVRIIGGLIDFIHKSLKDIQVSKRFLGVIIVILSLSISFLCYVLIRQVFGPFSIFFDIFLCYSLIALRDLFDHVKPVIDALAREDLEEARMYLSRVVGRSTEKLDKNGIVRACVETLAEGFVDGFVSPVFWFLVGALFGWPVALMLSYKVINTLDSMLGYKSHDLIEIGFASAKLDDIMNFIPARISLIILFIGALFSRFDAKKAFHIALRDRLKHSSPNSAHSEAFIAGAIGIRLGGLTHYFYGLEERAWIGDNKKEPELSDIARSIKLIKVSALTGMLLITLIALIHEIFL